MATIPPKKAEYQVFSSDILFAIDAAELAPTKRREHSQFLGC